jgi:gluconokinase
VGKRVAAALGGVFEDADDFHPEVNKEKMRAGIPLTDEDRWPWYARLRARVEEMRRNGTGVYVLACSALKAAYRDRLRATDAPDVIRFVHLKGPRDLIFSRMSARQGHYMPASLLDSQFAILEETPDLLNVSIEPPVETVAQEVLRRVGRGA